ncbi:MAG: hypothetical protein A4E53_03851 [Pelotomaculum sp. PtaB.Bin104]|nr:MAG: hypothetical protein A4E53_03851 [Pelotomaculum sp. PtaB.Bin104]
MTVKQGFRTSEVAKLTGLTQRQLDHWDRTGLFKPSLAHAGGRGSARFYSFLDVVQLRAAKKLLDAGLSSRRLRKCLIFLRNNLQENNFSALSLVTDGSSVFMSTEDPKVVVDLLEKGQVVWAVRLEGEDVSKVLQKEINYHPFAIGNK